MVAIWMGFFHVHLCAVGAVLLTISGIMLRLVQAFHLSRAIALSRATHARRPKRGMPGQHRISPLLRGESVVTPTSTEFPAASPSESVCLNMDESGSFEFSNPEVLIEN